MQWSLNAEEAYLNVFIQLKQLEPRISPTTIMTDYEIAAINAFKTALDVVDKGNLQDLRPHYGTSTMGVKDGLPKTNNSVEGWHNEFGSLLAANRPSIWKFIEGLQKQQSLN